MWRIAGVCKVIEQIQGVDYLLVHPQGLADAKLKDNSLKIGNGSYRYMVMPPLEFIPLEVLKKLKEFEAAGGEVLWVDRKPKAGMYPQDDAEVNKLLANAKVVTMDEVASQIKQPYSLAFDLNITTQPGKLEMARFLQKDKPVYYLVNRTGEPLTVNLTNKKKLTLYDPLNGGISNFPAKKDGDLTIEAYASVLLTE